MKEDAEATKECFEAEKAHWIDEKEKVIRYQKQLQLNYVQVIIILIMNITRKSIWGIYRIEMLIIIQSNSKYISYHFRCIKEIKHWKPKLRH